MNTYKFYIKTFFTIIFWILVNSNTYSQTSRHVFISVKFKTVNVEKDYDHLSRLKVYMNGINLITSSVKPESKLNKIRLSVNPGKYHIRLVKESFYQQKWQEHTIANNFAIDCSAEQTIELNKNLSLKIIFDLDKGTNIKPEWN